MTEAACVFWEVSDLSGGLGDLIVPIEVFPFWALLPVLIESPALFALIAFDCARAF